MNTMDLLELIGETPETYVLDAENTTARKLSAKRTRRFGGDFD